MATYNEADHPRGEDGKYTNKKETSQPAELPFESRSSAFAAPSRLTIGRYASSEETATDAMEQYGLNNGDGGWCEVDGDTLCVHYDAPNGTNRVVYMDSGSSSADVLDEMAYDMEGVSTTDTDADDVEYLRSAARMLREEADRYRR